MSQTITPEKAQEDLVAIRDVIGEQLDSEKQAPVRKRRRLWGVFIGTVVVAQAIIIKLLIKRIATLRGSKK